MKHLYLILFLCVWNVNHAYQKEPIQEDRTRVLIVTSKGEIFIELFNETPKHRNNFIKLVNEGFYNNMLWHRVVDDFLIQTGDPASYDAQPGEKIDSKGTGNLVPREIDNSLFHKRGALSAAHDGNPRFYSKAEFFIVQKGPIADDQFESMEEWINKQLAIYYTFQASSNSELLEQTLKAYEENDDEKYKELYDKAIAMASQVEDPDYYHFPEKHVAYYKEFGGMPFADQLHTVFGEVVTGMDVVDAIAGTETDENGRPIQDVRILSMQIIESHARSDEAEKP